MSAGIFRWRIGGTLFAWEAFGVVFITALGALLHFVFEWSGESAAVGAIASVNESVWEHFKQSIWPMLLYAAIEYPFIRKRANNFAAAKAAAAYLMPLFTGAVFYIYTSIIGRHILIVDIYIFLFAVAIGQMASYKILKAGAFGRRTNLIAAAGIVLIALMLVLFTYLPPHLPIFLDETGFYGLPY